MNNSSGERVAVPVDPLIRNMKLLRRSDLNQKRTRMMADRYGTLQNLLPLILLRPLRLCIPAEQLRTARIMLLKVTHSPWVTAIWLYESAKLYFVDTQVDRYWDMPSNRQQSPTRTSGSARSKRVQGSRAFSTMLASKSEASLPKTPMHSAHTSSAQASEITELKLMIRIQGNEVAELKQMIRELSDRV